MPGQESGAGPSSPQVAPHGQLSDAGHTDNFAFTDTLVPDQGARPVQDGQGELPGQNQQQGGQPDQAVPTAGAMRLTILQPAQQPGNTGV